MGQLTDIRVPLPLECETQLDCHRHLSEISDRLTANLKERLGEDFEVVRDPRPVAFGGQWARDTRVYRDGELRGTFSVGYDYVISPHDFSVSCQRPVAAPSLSKVPAIAASLLVSGGALAFGGPVAGLVTGGAFLLLAAVAGGLSPFAGAAEADTDGLPDLDGELALDPLLS